MDICLHSIGLNKFNGFSITNAALVKARPDGSNLIGDVTLPNPTVIVLDVGTLVLDVKSGDLLIGNATLTDVRLVPGSNTFPLSGVLDLGTVIDNLGDVLSTQGPALKHRNLSLSAVTKSITFENNFVEYYTDVLSQLTLTTEVAIGALLKNTIQNMDLGSILNGVSNNSDATALIDGAESKSEDSGSGGGGLANLADNLKRNIHIRDVLDQDHPDHGDAIIDSLVRTFDAP